MEAQHKAMALSRLETQNKIYNILTPDQKKQFNASPTPDGIIGQDRRS
jgi:protein CpxP